MIWFDVDRSWTAGVAKIEYKMLSTWTISWLIIYLRLYALNIVNIAYTNNSSNLEWFYAIRFILHIVIFDIVRHIHLCIYVCLMDNVLNWKHFLQIQFHLLHLWNYPLNIYFVTSSSIRMYWTIGRSVHFIYVMVIDQRVYSCFLLSRENVTVQKYPHFQIMTDSKFVYIYVSKLLKRSSSSVKLSFLSE